VHYIAMRRLRKKFATCDNMIEFTQEMSVLQSLIT